VRFSLDRPNLGARAVGLVRVVPPPWGSRRKGGGPSGVSAQGKRTQGFSRNLGGTAVSASKPPVGGPVDQSSRPSGACAPCPKGANKEHRRGTETRGKPSYRDGRQWSQHLIVPRKQGNPPQGSLWREGGAGKPSVRLGPGGSTVRRKERWRVHRDPKTSQRNFCG
jgi:hypothetical protein